MRKNNYVLWMFISIIFLIVAMSLTGCSEQTRMILMGESEHWRGELDTTVTSGREENGEYTILYKKENWEDIKGYKININEGRIINQGDGSPSNSIKIPITRTKGSQVSSNEEQTIVVEWTDINGNNLEEKLILREK